MLLMYSPKGSPRLQYIVNFFSHELFGSDIRITHDAGEYFRFNGARINYSDTAIARREVMIAPVTLLFENRIRQQNIECFDYRSHQVFFRTHGDLPFDIFAAAFYLLSRYEEYLPHERDMYGRFSHTGSLAFRQSFLHQPLVNIWLAEFKSLLASRFPELRFRGHHFSNLITYDIDMAYSYLHKGLWRNIGGTVKSILKGEWRRVFERWQVLAGYKKDPFDCYEWLDALQLYCRLKPYFFFLVAGKNSIFDKNIPTSSKKFRELIEYYAKTYNVGLHPSWQSGDDPSLLKEEHEWLEVVADKEITASRQHYIRMSLPDTYRRLIHTGITRDFSMGYGTINGFRASVASPFRWYDLYAEKSTALTVYPFCYMDANSYYENRHTPQQAFEELMNFYHAVKKVNGMLITVWHNTLLGTDRAAAGWSEMFQLFMKEMVYWDAYHDGSSELVGEVLFSRVSS